MALTGNYSLKPKQSAIDWMNLAQNSPVGQVAQGAAAGIPWGPVGVVSGAASSVLGAGINAFNQSEQDKKDEEERKALLERQNKQDNLAQKNTDRSLGMNSLSMMNDNYTAALVRMRRGY